MPEYSYTLHTIRTLWIAIILMVLSACSGSGVPSGLPAPLAEVPLHYAKGFTIKHYPGFTLVQVVNPWDSTKILNQYVLVPRESPLTGPFPQGILVQVPVESTACLTSIDAGFLHRIGAARTVTAIAESKYITVPEIAEGAKNGSIVSIGEATSVDIERLMEAGPEVVIVTPFQNTGYGKLGKAGIPLIECASYMEVSPLGRAEWIKFLAAFYNQEQRASAVFDSITFRYQALMAKAAETISHPTVVSEKKYGSMWHVPGGQSYMATFFRDAGADYYWKHTSETGSIGLSFEEVFHTAGNADFWLLKFFGEDRELTYRELEAEFDLYARFKSFEDRNIWVCNTARTPYYEEGTLEPDVILADLISIFHPGLLPGYSRKYFQPLSH